MQGPRQALPQTSPGQAAPGTCPRHALSCRVDWEEARGQRSTRQSPRCRRQANQGALSKCFKHKWGPSVCANAEQRAEEHGAGLEGARPTGARSQGRFLHEPQLPGPGRTSGARWKPTMAHGKGRRAWVMPVTKSSPCKSAEPQGASSGQENVSCAMTWNAPRRPRCGASPRQVPLGERSGIHASRPRWTCAHPAGHCSCVSLQPVH